MSSELLILQRWPALGRPLRSGCMPCRARRDSRTAQLFQVRRRELHLPLLQFGVTHLELIRPGFVPAGDTSALVVGVNLQVDARARTPSESAIQRSAERSSFLVRQLARWGPLLACIR